MVRRATKLRPRYREDSHHQEHQYSRQRAQHHQEDVENDEHFSGQADRRRHRLCRTAHELDQPTRQQVVESRISRLWRGLHLLPRALLRILVRAEAQKARAVTESLLLHLVETHFADDLRTDLVPWKIFSLRPARSALGRAAPLLLDRLIFFKQR